MPRSIECAHRKYEKVSRVTEYWNTQYFVLDKGNVAKFIIGNFFHVGGVS